METKTKVFATEEQARSEFKKMTTHSVKDSDLDDFSLSEESVSIGIVKLEGNKLVTTYY